MPTRSKKKSSSLSRPNSPRRTAHRMHLYMVDYSQFTLLSDTFGTATQPEVIKPFADTTFLDWRFKRCRRKPSRFTQLCHDLLILHSTLPQPIDFDRHSASFLYKVINKKFSEERSKLLLSFLISNYGVPEWLGTRGNILGVLTPEETKTLSELIKSACNDGELRKMLPQPGFGSFLGRLVALNFNGSYDIGQTVRSIRSFLESAVDNERGVLLARA
jgi:hypothetical protein